MMKKIAAVSSNCSATVTSTDSTTTATNTAYSPVISDTDTHATDLTSVAVVSGTDTHATDINAVVSDTLATDMNAVVSDTLATDTATAAASDTTSSATDPPAATPNSCQHCTKSFSQKYVLYRHIRRVHKREPEIEKGKFPCLQCDAKFFLQKNLYRHTKDAHNIDLVQEKRNERRAKRSEPVRSFDFTRDVNNSMYICSTCQQPFQTKVTRDLHTRVHKRAKKFTCKHCFKPFGKFNSKQLHERSCSSTQACSSSLNQIGGGVIDTDDDAFTIYETALNNIFKSHRLRFDANPLNLIDRLQNALRQAHDVIVDEQESNRPRKVYMSLQVHFHKAVNPDAVTFPAPTFNTEPVVILAATDIQEVVEMFFANLFKQIDNYEKSGSGWVLHSLVALDLNLLRYKPLRASSYIKMSKKFQNKKGYVNINNDDEKCFLWSVLAHLHPARHNKERVAN